MITKKVTNMTRRNENRKGYKETKVGWIPDEWECIHLKEIARINTETLAENTKKKYSFHYLDLGSVARGEIRFPESKMEFSKSPSRARRIVRKGDVLLATVRPNLKGFAYVEVNKNDLICSTGYAVVRSLCHINSKYIYYNLYTHETEKYFYACVVGSNYPALNNSDVENLKIPLPPLPEQIKIAEILSTWDRAIEQVHRLIDAKKRFKKGLMQQLLAGRLRFPGFGKPVKRKGELPEGWVELNLDKLGKCIRGVTYNKEKDLFSEDLSSSCRLLRANNIQEDCLVFKDIQFVNNKKVRKDQYLVDGDIVICMANGSKELVGKNAQFITRDSFRYTIGAFCSVFRPKKEYGEVVKQVFLSNGFKKWIDRLISGSSINNLRPADVLFYKFKVPKDGSERQMLTRLLFKYDFQICLLNRWLKIMINQKKGLVQKLLTGEKRVKV